MNESSNAVPEWLNTESPMSEDESLFLSMIADEMSKDQLSIGEALSKISVLSAKRWLLLPLRDEEWREEASEERALNRESLLAILMEAERTRGASLRGDAFWKLPTLKESFRTWGLWFHLWRTKKKSSNEEGRYRKLKTSYENEGVLRVKWLVLLGVFCTVPAETLMLMGLLIVLQTFIELMRKRKIRESKWEKVESSALAVSVGVWIMILGEKIFSYEYSWFASLSVIPLMLALALPKKPQKGWLEAFDVIRKRGLPACGRLPNEFESVCVWDAKPDNIQYRYGLTLESMRKIDLLKKIRKEQASLIEASHSSSIEKKRERKRL